MVEAAEQPDSPKEGPLIPWAVRPSNGLDKPIGTPVDLVVNYFRMSLPVHKYIYNYAVLFEPEIEGNNTRLKKLIVNRHGGEEVSKLFHPYLFTGTNLFTSKDIGAEGATCLTIRDPGNEARGNPPCDYNVSFSLTNMIESDDLKRVGVMEDKKAETFRHFLNIIIKQLMQSLQLRSIGRARDKYFDTNSGQVCPEYNLEVWPGYKATVRNTGMGIMLQVDPSTKCLRTITALESFYDLGNQAEHRGENSIDYIKREMKKKSVMARYGNTRQYVVDDVDFTKNPTNHTFECKGVMMNIVQYMKKRYQVDIKDLEQPLLVNEKENKAGVMERIYLVPELCTMTGISEEMVQDRRVMQTLAQYTKKTPDQRIQQSKSLLREFERMNIQTSHPNERQPGQILADWNITFVPEPATIKGIQLPDQVITLGNGHQMPIDHNGTFMFKTQINQPIPLARWIIVFKEQDYGFYESIVNNLYTAAQTFGINVDFPLKAQVAGRGDAKSFWDAVNAALQEKGATMDKLQIVMFLLPQKNMYKELKRNMASVGIVSQCILTSTVRSGKNIMSVMGKVALQMNAKMKGKLWELKMHPDFDSCTMFVGIDVSREGGKSYLGFASSFDRSFSEYKTQTLDLGHSKAEIAGSLRSFMKEALLTFYKENKIIPTQIIVYRDGVGESQKVTLYQTEILSMLEQIREMYKDKRLPEEKRKEVKAAFITVNKKLSTRFFSSGGGGGGYRGGRGRGGGYGGGANDNPQTLDNPHAGTVVQGRNTILDEQKYDFLLMPHYVNQGTGTPSHFHVLYDNTGNTTGLMQYITNALCYLYYNWQGAIRTPAPCQYAMKAAQMQAGVLRDQLVTPPMNTTHYYL